MEKHHAATTMLHCGEVSDDTQPLVYAKHSVYSDGKMLNFGLIRSYNVLPAGSRVFCLQTLPKVGFFLLLLFFVFFSDSGYSFPLYHKAVTAEASRQQMLNAQSLHSQSLKLVL